MATPVTFPALPIADALPALRGALASHARVVLQAPPGAGKTTIVPLALLDEPWLDGARIVMLEPRRLAARASARRMASLLGEAVGGTVGLRTRIETRVGRRTRIEVITEGVLARMHHHDPTLDGIGLVILDEFHERSVHADLALALTLETQAVVRDALRVLVMSATLDGARVSALLAGRRGATGPDEGAPVIVSAGRAYPVETRWRPPHSDARLEASVAAVVREALAGDEGDVLVFLPGAAEIRRVATLLGAELPPHVHVLPLHGTLPQEAQDAALAPSPPGSRAVVLATSIAETSLTIPGVRVVVDAGLARVPRFSARSGMTRLETVRVSRASADQRRGRAGRVAPGVCYRLWEAHEEHGLVPHATPQILEADLAPLALDLAAAGITDPASLRWLDPPPAASYAQARALLVQLGALTSADAASLTAHGRRMSELALHPRLAHMLIAAQPLGLGATACDLAALLGERDFVRGERGAPEADLRLRLELLRGGSAPAGTWVDRDAVRRARAEGDRLRRALRIPERDADAGSCGLLVAFAYPERIAMRRPGDGAGRFVLRNGLGAAFGEPQSLSNASFLAVAELDGRQPESRIYFAAPLELAEIERHFGTAIERDHVVEWDDAARSARARTRRRLGAIVLTEGPAPDADADALGARLAEQVRSAGLEVLEWSDAARHLRARLAFAHRLDASAWPDSSSEALRERTDDWLAPAAAAARGVASRVNVYEALLSLLDWRARAELDDLAPTHLVVPSGSRVAIDYSDPAAPVLAVRLQEVFGLGESPRIGGGRVPVTLHLLSPAHRPVQVTRDLAGFWRTTYFEVRRELKGRYPKHFWPEDPLVAEPTRRTKPRVS